MVMLFLLARTASAKIKSIVVSHRGRTGPDPVVLRVVRARLQLVCPITSRS